MVTIF